MTPIITNINNKRKSIPKNENRDESRSTNMIWIDNWMIVNRAISLAIPTYSGSAILTV